MKTFHKASRGLAVVSTLLVMAGMPLMASAATVSGQINDGSLVATSSKPTLSGTATGTKTVRLTIRKEGSTKTLYTSKLIRVKDGKWKTRVSKKLSDATYEVRLSKSGKTKFLDKETLVVDTDDTTSNTSSKNSKSVLSVSAVPLLSGGMTRAGASVPISYLKVVNTGKEPIDINGFSVKQNGSASTKSIIGLTASDDTGSTHGSVGGTEGTTPFKDGIATVPVYTTVAPGSMRLFTIKAVLSNNASAYIGKQLMIDVASVGTNGSTKGAFPIRGTTWMIGY